MEKKAKTRYIFAVLGIVAMVFTLIAILAIAQSIGSSRVSLEEDAPAAALGRRYTYLVLGKDRASGLTDVMMLVSVDTGNKRASVLQIPRDTYAEFRENGYRKFNGALSALGAEGLCDFIEENMSLSLDGYFLFDLDVFKEAVDAIGGVEIDLPQSLYYRDEYQGLDIRLEAGKHLLDGEDAESFVRYRSGYLRGDLGRIDAQKLFISSFIRKVKVSLTPASALRIAGSLWGDIETNVGLSELASVALSAYETDEADISMATLAGEDIRSSESGAWFYVLSKSSCERMLSEAIGSSGGFDRNGVFRNASSAEFERIYHSDIPYDVRNSKDISENGIEIAKQ